MRAGPGARQRDPQIRGVPTGKVRYDNLKSAVAQRHGEMVDGRQVVAETNGGPDNDRTPEPAAPGRLPTRPQVPGVSRRVGGSSIADGPRRWRNARPTACSTADESCVG
jgi:hypothetical protein